MTVLKKAAIAFVLWLARVVFRPRAHLSDGNVIKKNFCPNEPSVIIANHTSHRDAIMLLGITGIKKVSFLVAKDWYDKKQFTWILKAAGGIPCDRTGLDTGWLRSALAAIAEGKSVIIFPEGHTRQDGETDQFKSGFAMLAAMTGAPVLPLGISGKYKLFHPTHFAVGTTVKLERSNAMNASYLKDETQKLRTAVEDLSHSAQNY